MKEVYLAAVALVAMMAVVNAGESLAAIPKKCPLKDPMDTTIHLAHEKDCTKFYKCLAGEKYVMDCPDMDKKGNKLYFNPELQVCDWPWNVTCNGNGGGDDPCPTDSNGNVIKTPHEGDCKYYYDCKDGRLIPTPCPIGQYFDSIRLVCDRQDRVTCYNNQRPTPKPTPTPTPRPPPTPTPRPIQCYGQFKDSHETSCSYYYECVNNRIVLKMCPRGLHFGPFVQKCTTPEEAFCMVESGKVTTSSSTAVTKPTTTSTTESSTVNTNPPPTNTKKPGRPKTCPHKGSTEIVFLPHECQCNIFYRCKDGEKIHTECDTGMHFDYIRQVCDDPTVVNCVRPIPDDPETAITSTTKEKATEATPSITPTTSQSKPTETPNECPKDAYGIVKLPHEKKCSLYYRCVGGEKKLSKCPRGLHFHPIVKLCDLPDKVGCIDKPDDDDDNTSDEQTTKSPADLYPPSPDCPPKGSTRDLYLPHECDCNMYYQCTDGYKVLKRCPGEFEFDELREACDLPFLVKCSLRGTTTGETTPTRPSFAVTTENTLNCIGECPDEDSMDFTVLLPHKECAKYCSCGHGMATVLHCPAGLHFSPKKGVCVWPREAKCKPGKLEARSYAWESIPLLGEVF